MTSQSSTLMLGKTCLDDYVSGPVETKEVDKKIKVLVSKVNEIDEFLEENSRNTKSFEQQILANINQNKKDYLDEIKNIEISKQYKKIGLSFLSMNHRRGILGNSKVPRFAVYIYDGSNKFDLSYSKQGNFKIKRSPRLPKAIEKHLFKNYKFLDSEQDSITSEKYKKYELAAYIAAGALATGLLFGCANEFDHPGTSFLDSLYPMIISSPLGGLLGFVIGLGKQQTGEDKVYTFSTQFNGIIPQQTKEKAIEAKTIFQNELYLIAETKPEDWNAKVSPKTDPLLVGICKDNCYLIDHFNTTPLENYVRSEFTF